MSITLVEAWREKQRGKWIVKFLLRRVAQPCVLVVLAYVFPKMAIFYAICGLYARPTTMPIPVIHSGTR